MCLFGVGKIIWRLKFQGSNHAHLGSEIKGKRHPLVSQNMFYLNNIYLQFTEALDAHRKTLYKAIFISPNFLVCLKISGGQLIICSLSKGLFDYLGVWENCLRLALPFQKSRSSPLRIVIEYAAKVCDSSKWANQIGFRNDNLKDVRFTNSSVSVTGRSYEARKLIKILRKFLTVKLSRPVRFESILFNCPPDLFVL